MCVVHTFDINCHCDSIIDFLANSYFIVQIYHAKSFKMKYFRSLYLNFLKIFIKTFKSVVRFNVHKTLLMLYRKSRLLLKKFINEDQILN